MISRLLFYKSDSFNPYQNLAIENFLSKTVDQNSFILYLWQNQNTVVIGKNQNPWNECNCSLLLKEGGFVARRNSGGGAVFHDKGNLNFTFICKKGNYNQTQNFEIIKTACKYAGIPAEISGRNDVLVNGKKFSGNAFYHSGDISYHHGTLLISSNQQKIERYLTPNKEKLASKGIKSVKSRVINLTETNPSLTTEKFAEFMLKATEEQFALSAKEIKPIPNTAIESDISLFSNWDYIYGKTPPFSFSISQQTSLGHIQINLNFSGGKITETKVFTDSMDFTLPEQIEKALIGCSLQVSQLKTALTCCFCDYDLKDLLSSFEEILY